MSEDGVPPLPAGVSMAVRKWDVIDSLRRRNSLKTFVQILTPSTGPDMHGREEITRFGSATTLMYAVDRQRRDRAAVRGLPTLDELEASLRARPLHTDMVLVDCWHSHDDTVRCISMARSMLTNGGFIVVHDCDPPDRATSTADPEGYYWCGVAWQGFVDATAALDAEAQWWVVESDFGIGVIAIPKPSLRRTVGATARRLAAPLRRGNRATPGRRVAIPPDHDEAWDWFVEH